MAQGRHRDLGRMRTMVVIVLVAGLGGLVAHGSPAEKAAALNLSERAYHLHVGCARAAVETFLNDLALRRAGLT